VPYRTYFRLRGLYGTVRYGTVRYAGTVQYGTVRHGTAPYGTVRDRRTVLRLALIRRLAFAQILALRPWYKLGTAALGPRYKSLVLKIARIPRLEFPQSGIWGFVLFRHEAAIYIPFGDKPYITTSFSGKGWGSMC